jgi:hypothetical protein
MPQYSKTVVEQLGLGRNSFTLGVLPPNRSATAFANPEEALFATKVPQLLANYYETWRRTDASDEYYLDRAYLHMHVVVKGASRQVLSLHCDPALAEADQHYRYKRGPHIHVDSASPDVSRAHLSVCLLDDHLGGRDIAALNRALTAAVHMIDAEFVPQWERAGRA